MVDHKTLQDKIDSYAKALGVFAEVLAFEPASAPTAAGTTFAHWFGPMFPAPRESGLSATSVVQMMQARLYLNISNGRDKEAETKLMSDTTLVMRKLSSEISFGIDDKGVWTDLLGAKTRGVRADPGYVRFPNGGPLFRISDITIPVILENFLQQGGG